MNKSKQIGKLKDKNSRERSLQGLNNPLLELKYYNRNRLLFLAVTYNNTYNMTSHYSKHSQTF